MVPIVCPFPPSLRANFGSRTQPVPALAPALRSRLWLVLRVTAAEWSHRPVTYLLIHGGGSTARFWDRLLPYLDHPALAVDLPGRNGKPADFATLTVGDEVASVLADVAAATGMPAMTEEIVVVAHSSGGLVVPGVVAGLGDRVAHVVLSAGLVPPEGGCGIDCMKPAHRDGLVLAVEDARRSGTVITLPAPPRIPRPFGAPTAATRSTTTPWRSWWIPSAA